MAINPETLFEVIFKRLIQEKKDQIGNVDGLVTFIVTGEQSGVWTLDLRKGGTGDVLVGKVENPDVAIMLAYDFLDEFISGNVDSKKAVENNKLGVVGDEKIFKNFSVFLGAGLSQVDLRAQQ